MRRLSDERGAVGVFMAITIVALFGMLGLAVDVGHMYQERGELRNGADAAALAIAEDCALGVGSCDPYTARAQAKEYAADNASDGYANVDSVALDTVGKSVRVITSTLTSDGSTILKPFFASVVGFGGSTVYGDATAVWGYPASMRDVLPLIISECEFPGADQLPTPERTLYFHDGNSADSCNAVAGQDVNGDNRLSGGFGWLLTDGSCASTLDQGTWVLTDVGSSVSYGCAVSYIRTLLNTPVPLPIFDDITGLGSTGKYHVAGFAMFVITGYHFGGQYSENAPCRGDARCVSGYFTTGIVHDGVVGGTNRGVVIIKLTD
jgi:Flp pilus assembly protein TadG